MKPVLAYIRANRDFTALIVVTAVILLGGLW